MASILLSKKKETEDEQSLREGAYTLLVGPTQPEPLCFSSPVWMLYKCQRPVFGM